MNSESENTIIHQISSFTNSVRVDQIINLNNPNINVNYKDITTVQFHFSFTYRTKLTTGYGHVSQEEDGHYYTYDQTITAVDYSPTLQVLSPPLALHQVRSLEGSYKALSPILSSIGVESESALTDVAEKVTEFCNRFINVSPMIVCAVVEMEKEVEQWECESCSSMGGKDEFFWLDNMGIVDLHLDAYRVGEDDEKLGENCSVCLDEFEAGTKGARMPDCLHLFHVDCIANWLRKNPSCPVCRSQLYPTSPL
ncbi:hypothetical protein CsatB_021563 [Cannabis sativa]